MTGRPQAPKKLPGWVWGGLFGCAVIMGWMGWTRPGPVTAEEYARLASEVGGEEVLNILRSAERVYATRIRIAGGREPWETLEDFEAVSEPVLLDDADRKMVKTLLTSPRNYDLAVKACQPRWGFRLRFLAGDDAVTVWVCLECDHMLFQRDGDKDGNGAWFDPMEREINALAIRLFPDDEAIAEAARN